MKPQIVFLVFLCLFQAQCSWVDDLLNKSESDEPIQTFGASVCSDRDTDRRELIQDQISDQDMQKVMLEFERIKGESQQASFQFISKQQISDSEVKRLIEELAAEAFQQSQAIAAKDEVLAKRLDQGYYQDLYMNIFANGAKSTSSHTCLFLNYIYQYSFRDNLANTDRDFKTQLELTTFTTSTGEKIVCELLDKAVEELQKFIFCNDERDLPSSGGGDWDDDD